MTSPAKKVFSVSKSIGTPCFTQCFGSVSVVISDPDAGPVQKGKIIKKVKKKSTI